MITVYHLNPLTESERAQLNGPNGGWDSSPRFSRYANVSALGELEAVREAWNLGEYSHVADVETDDLETAFERTNSITHAWVLNADAGARVAGARSTSVGDVMETADGRRYVVAAFGFEELGA